jgi:hypothetical protein
MEHTQNIRMIIAAALVVAATGGLAACGTPQSEAGGAAISHRLLVRESADRYVEELEARAQISHRLLLRESADRYVEELLQRAHRLASEIAHEGARAENRVQSAQAPSATPAYRDQAERRAEPSPTLNQTFDQVERRIRLGN